MKFKQVTYLFESIVKKYWDKTTNKGREYLYNSAENLAYDIAGQCKSEKEFEEKFDNEIYDTLKEIEN